MTRHERVWDALKSIDPELAQKVQFATGVQTEFAFPAVEPLQDHDWRFVGMDLESGALARFQCARCSCWMSRQTVGNSTKVQYYAADSPLCQVLTKRPVCRDRRGGDDDA